MSAREDADGPPLRIDDALDRVKARESEVTFDTYDWTSEQVDALYAAAKARGLDASGTRRCVLIRDLRGMRLGR